MANLNIPSTRDRTLDAFKGKMVGGGARPNLFECELFFPDDAIPTDSSTDEIADKSRFLVKAAQLPASNIAPILVPFRGRNLKIAGDRTFDPWTITIINDTNFHIRDAMERWSDFINDIQTAQGSVDPESYQKNAFVKQLSRQGSNPSEQVEILREYKFTGIYPSVVSSIPLDYGATDQIEEFQVTFNYLFWEVVGGTTDYGGTLNEET